MRIVPGDKGLPITRTKATAEMRAVTTLLADVEKFKKRLVLAASREESLSKKVERRDRKIVELRARRSEDVLTIRALRKELRDAQT